MKKTFWAIILLTLCVLFVAVPVLAQDGNQTSTEDKEHEGLLGALETLKDNPAAYRLVIGLIVAIIINIAGYLSNVLLGEGISYNPRQFADTLLLYEPLILLFAEAMPVQWAIVGAIIVDVWRRTYKALEEKA